MPNEKGRERSVTGLFWKGLLMVQGLNNTTRDRSSPGETGVLLEIIRTDTFKDVMSRCFMDSMKESGINVLLELEKDLSSSYLSLNCRQRRVPNL